MAIALIGLVTLFADAGDRQRVLALRTAVPAGTPLRREMLSVVEIGTDDGIAVTDADRLDEVVGQYARFGLAAGALLAPGSVQPEPLVGPGAVLVAVEVAPGEVPVGLGAGDAVMLVVVGPEVCTAADADGTDVTRPGVGVVPAKLMEPAVMRGGGTSGATSAVLSVEIPVDDLVTVKRAESVTVALPNTPPASTEETALCADPAAPAAPAVAPTTAPTQTSTAPAPTGAVAIDPEVVLIPPPTT